MSGPIEVALCALDSGGGKGFDWSEVWDQAFDLDGGSVFEAMGVYDSKTFARAYERDPEVVRSVCTWEYLKRYVKGGGATLFWKMR